MDYKKILEGVVDIINTAENSDIGFANICTYIGENCPELKESEDEKIRKELITHCRNTRCVTEEGAERIAKWIAWLEKQGKEKSKKASIWKHWKDGIAGNEEGKLIYLIKNGNDYLLSSCLGFECDYIELSKLDNLMLEKQGEQKPVWGEEDEKCLENAIMYCEWARDKAPDLPCYETSEKSIGWLKSLKQKIGGEQ